MKHQLAADLGLAKNPNRMRRHAETSTQFFDSRQEEFEQLRAEFLCQPPAAFNTRLDAKELIARLRVEVFAPGLNFGADGPGFLGSHAGERQIGESQNNRFQ